MGCGEHWLAHVERSHAPMWPLPNVWLGTSVEDQKRADERIPILLDTPAAVRWLSCEPLLGPVDLDWKVPTKKSGTCDKPVCISCTFSPAPDKDLCAEHALAFGMWKAGRK
jgi:protein gp37